MLEQIEGGGERSAADSTEERSIGSVPRSKVPGQCVTAKECTGTLAAHIRPLPRVLTAMDGQFVLRCELVGALIANEGPFGILI